MKSTTKKALSTLLALVLVFGLFAAMPLMASAMELFADHPESKTIKEGEDVTFGISIWLPDISCTYSFQWYVDDGSGWAPVPGGAPYTSSGTDRYLKLENVPASFDGYLYRCWAERLIPPDDYASGYSEVAKLTVTPTEPPTVTEPGKGIIIGEQPKSQTIKEGEDTYFQCVVIETVSSATFQWYVDDGSGWKPVPEAAPYSGSTNWSLSLKEVPASYDGNKYRCKVTASYNGETVWEESAIVTLTVIPAAAGPTGMANFEPTRTYTRGMFTDINEDDWWGFNQLKFIATAYEYSLVNGMDATTFGPTGNFTVMQAIALAARVHCIYTTGKDGIIQGTPWYQAFLDYAIANGIVAASDFTDLERPCTRAEMAYIFSRCLPAEEFAKRNTVNSLPDVGSSTLYYASIIMLYEAGVISGNDTAGTFTPNDNMTRAMAAGIINKIILPAARGNGKTFG